LRHLSRRRRRRRRRRLLLLFLVVEVVVLPRGDTRLPRFARMTSGHFVVVNTKAEEECRRHRRRGERRAPRVKARSL
tara:strand:- start:7571 stop:7801 length:231 start_codon:yes stop_codon:yes gene_type:complete